MEKELKNSGKNKDQKSKFAPKKTSKDEVYTAISSTIGELKDMSQALLKLISILEQTQRADVSLTTVEEAKNTLSGMDACRKHVVVLRDTLRSRARTRLLEM